MDFKNYAEGATSIGHMILQLKDYINDYEITEDDIAIFFITSVARTLFFDDDGNPQQIYPWIDMEKGEASHAYYKYFHTVQQEQFNMQTWILSLQRMCEHAKINDYYIIGWSDCDLDFPGINKNKIYNKTCAELFGVSGEDEFTKADHSKYVKTGDCHPNQLGHQLIADTLTKWITNE